MEKLQGRAASQGLIGLFLRGRQAAMIEVCLQKLYFIEISDCTKLTHPMFSTLKNMGWPGYEASTKYLNSDRKYLVLKLLSVLVCMYIYIYIYIYVILAGEL